MGMSKKLVASGAVVVGLLAGSALAAAQDKAASERPKIVATFSILGDLVKNVAGERADVSVLVGPDGDAHVYAPSPADAKKVAGAKVVVLNGLGFEGWIARLVRASGAAAAQIVAGNGVKPRRAARGHGHDDDADPHAWQSVANAKLYVANIRDGLIKADPAGRPAYEANAAAYLAKLDALDREVMDVVARIPADRRKIITTHDAFGYFAQAYGIAFIAPQGVSTEAEVSARDLARIITQIRRQKIPAVFLENVTDPRLVRRIAEETGAKIGGTLYSDALTDANGDAPTYIDMMRHNIRTLAAALMS
jgi:zinc/manganese transport system substrate-binding protein